MATTTSTTAAAVIETVVSSLIQETLLQESVMIPTISNFTAMIRDGMDTLDIPRFTALTPEDVTEGSALTSQTSTIAVDSLVLDINSAIHFAISDRADVQAKVNMVAQLTKDGARNMAAQIDDKIIEQLNDASAATPDHIVPFANAGSGDSIQLGDIVAARKLLNDARVPMSERFLLLPTSQEAFMLLIPNFIEVEKYGTADAIQNGELGRIYGMTVILSTSSELSQTSFLEYHRSAVGYASQISPKFEQDRNIIKLEDEFTLSQLYGIVLLDETGGAGNAGGVRQVLTNEVP